MRLINVPRLTKSCIRGAIAYYDRMITIDLSKQEAMIALPFHPSNAYTIHEFLQNAEELLKKVEQDAQKRFPKANVKLVDKIHDGGVWADQGVIAGCSGGLFDNIAEAADIMRGGSTGNGEFALDVYPTSIPGFACAHKTRRDRRLAFRRCNNQAQLLRPVFRCG